MLAAALRRMVRPGLACAAAATLHLRPWDDAKCHAAHGHGHGDERLAALERRLEQIEARVRDRYGVHQTSGQNDMVFSWEEALTAAMPPEARAVEKDMHGGFHEDSETGVVYTGMPRAGLFALSADLKTWSKLGNDPRLEANIHGLVVFKHGGVTDAPLNQSRAFADDALDMLAFVAGDASASKWAATRAAMGHAAPFAVPRVEVGNEERDMSPAGYPAHYKLITGALWAKHPSLVIVASGRWGPPIDGSPCLTGQRCDEWDDHYYRTPDAMAAMGGTYDGYDRSLPKVFVGEFAANIPQAGVKQRSLRAAVAEAIFLLGYERNADVVVASSFAPLLNNVHGTQWGYNLLNFNATSLFVLPSYHVQSLFARSLGSHTLPTAVRGDCDSTPCAWLASASVGPTPGNVTIKLANYGEGARTVHAALDGWRGKRFAVASAMVLTADSADASNSLDEPGAVRPASLSPAPTVVPTGLRLTMPPWSVVVVRAALV